MSVGEWMTSEEWDAVPAGAMFIDSVGDYWIKPYPSESHHLEYALIGLIGGRIKGHYSRLGKITRVAPWEIQW